MSRTRTGSTSSNPDHQAAKKDKDKVPFGKCGIGIGPKDDSLQCEVCEIWYHIACQNVNKALYEVLRQDSEAENHAHWYCIGPCNKIACKILSGIMSVEVKVDKLTKDVENVNSKMTQLDVLSKGNSPRGWWKR